MASGSVRYDEEKNIVYATAGDTHLGEELDEFAQKWDALVVDNDMKDFNKTVDKLKAIQETGVVLCFSHDEYKDKELLA